MSVPVSVPVSVLVLVSPLLSELLLDSAAPVLVLLLDAAPVLLDPSDVDVEVVPAAPVLELAVSGSGNDSVGSLVTTPSVSSGHAQLLGLGLSQRT